MTRDFPGLPCRIALIAAAWLGCGDKQTDTSPSSPGEDSGDQADDTGELPTDRDGDGYDSPEDCDDTDPSIHPGAEEIWYDGVDQDCDGNDDDADGDGHSIAVDCDDGDHSIHPGAADLCDGVDSDCDGVEEPDADDDGVRVCAGDCDDADPAIGPHVDEVCGNGVDEDCDGGPGDCGVRGALSLDDADLELPGSGGENLGAQVVLVSQDSASARIAVGAPEFDELAYSGGRVAIVDLVLTDEGLASEEVGVVWGATADDRLGSRLASPGDIDGDGFIDLLVRSAYSTPDRPSSIYLVSGPLTGEHSTDTSGHGVESEAEWSLFGGSLSGLADQNADGLAEFVVGDSEGSTSGPAAYLFFGPGTQASYDVDADVVLIDGDPDGNFPGRLEGRHDLNGDGIADLVASDSTYNLNGDEGAAFVFHGPVTQSGSAADLAVKFADRGGEGMLGGIWTGSDLDGDGLNDLVLGDYTSNPNDVASAGTLFIFPGPAEEPTVWYDAPIRVEGIDEVGALGYEIGGSVDLDGDGHQDLLSSGNYASGSAYHSGRTYVFHGPFSGIMSADAAAATIDGNNSSDRIASALLGLGDVDQDGFDDFVLGTPYIDGDISDDGALYLFLGGGM